MKNFVFISPNFPANYWHFCAELKRNGMNVLGIGDCPYDQLIPELKDALTEYYWVPTLENSEAVFRAVAYFTYTYGKINWLESNNEYWLEQDAWLRTEFNIPTGFHTADMHAVKYKSAMKARYAAAGNKTARWHMVRDYTGCKDYIDEVGYPVIVKPDNGVGASHTYKFHNDDELNYFFATKDNAVSFIMEEFVDGTIHTYDAIVNSVGQPLFETGNVTLCSIMDTVNQNGNAFYYIEKDLPEVIRDAGRRAVKAFGVKSRFVHFEFFILNHDHPVQGRQGDLLGLEVNMRPSGGFSTDMFNFANSTDVYKIWADMVAFDGSTLSPEGRQRFYCCFCGRRDGLPFAMDHDAILRKYGCHLRMVQRMPEALADAMGNMLYMATFSTPQERDGFFSDLLAVR